MVTQADVSLRARHGRRADELVASVDIGHLGQQIDDDPGVAVARRSGDPDILARPQSNLAESGHHVPVRLGRRALGPMIRHRLRTSLRLRLRFDVRFAEEMDLRVGSGRAGGQNGGAEQ